MLVDAWLSPIRETFIFMPAIAQFLHYIISIVAIAVFVYGIYRKYKLWKIDNFWKELRSDFTKRIRIFIKNVIFQRKVFNRVYGGIMHTGIYFGLIVLIIGTIIVAVDFDVLRPLNRVFLAGNTYLVFEFVLDVFGVVLFIGLILAFFRRLYLKPESLENTRGDFFALSLLLIIAVSGFILEGLRLSITQVPWAKWSFFGFAISRFFAGSWLSTEFAVTLYQIIWWFHVSLSLSLIALIPFTRLHHIITSSINIFFSTLRPRGELTTPFDLMQLLESESFDVKIGTDQIDDFGWKQRLSLDACVNCGRCQDVCPATIAGRSLSPMKVIQKLNHQMVAEFRATGKENKSQNLFDGIIGEDEVWSCTTCWACVAACPVMIDQLGFLVDFRRLLVAESKIDRKKTEIIVNFAEKSNPYGIPAIDRANWAKDLDVKTLHKEPNAEYLYWVGCASSYDPRNQKIAKSLVKIFQKAGVSFGILGVEEKCCGETLRRMGDEGRFQELVLENIEILNKYGIKKIIIHCPHGYNTLKNEYPKFGGNFKVIHHTDFILSLMNQGKIIPHKKLSETIVYHDPCYLARYNEIYETPRQLLQSTATNIREFSKNRILTFCCGGGGGNAWYEVPEKKRISTIRVEEMEQTGAELLTVACPFCITMFEDAIKGKGLEEKLQVKEIAELIAETI